MKKIVEQALKELKQQLELDEDVMTRFQILTPKELANLENVPIRDSFETWGYYKLAVLYSDFPDYFFLEDDSYTLEDLKRDLTTWIHWCNIIK